MTKTATATTTTTTTTTTAAKTAKTTAKAAKTAAKAVKTNAELPRFDFYARANSADEGTIMTIVSYIKRKEAAGFRVVLTLNTGNNTERMLRENIAALWGGEIEVDAPQWYPQKGGPIDLGAGRKRDERIVAKLAAKPVGFRGVMIFGEVFLEDQYSRDKRGDSACYAACRAAGIPVVGVHGDPASGKLVYYAKA